MSLWRERGRHWPGAVLALGLAVLAGCDRCGDSPAATGLADSGRSAATLPQPKEVERRLEGGPVGWEPGILVRDSLWAAAGEMDVKNHYASAVMVSFNAEGEAPQCSGALVEPNLVLTAGSCVCAGRQASEDTGGGEHTLVDASECMERVFVTLVTYGAVLDQRYKETAIQKRYQTSPGIVRPHPDLRVVRDAQDAIVSSHADLAAIVLEAPMSGRLPLAALARAEARSGESLVMAGFAHDGRHGFGGIYGVRYFRRNPVTHVSENGRVFYEQRGTYVYNGYAGGPCFREEEGKRSLVGVADMGSEEQLACTSVSFFREWLRSEIAHAAGRTGARPGPSHPRK